MKHLKKYNEADAFKQDNETFDNNTYTIIKIKPLPIYNEHTTKLDILDKRMKYFNDVIECSKRLQDALEREIRLQDLFNTDGGEIYIWIDDIKNKGKKWSGK